ncbi:NAD(P)-dependent alcohol dehydrogenase, partial [Streptomyces rhizosphaericus]|uniref:NAD(P)-dependent alcohol dehydrogenase n=1 Tax=Streptomyces rhizosphaericus TaxID=114699 RepID=UPI000A36DF8A
KYAVGDRVGVGCFVDSCRECENCLAGEEQYCLKGEVPTYNGNEYDGAPTYGGYSTHIVVDENYVLRIPEGISLDVAAPLLCAEVTVLSQTLRKRDDGLRLGADHFYATSDESTFTELAGTFDLIVNTTSANLPLDGYLSLLKLDGTLVHVGAPENPSAFNQFSLIMGRRSMAGSKIGGIRQTQEMLDFCAEHGLGAEIELIDGERINEAYDRVVGSDVRYRFVIDIASLKA